MKTRVTVLLNCRKQSPCWKFPLTPVSPRDRHAEAMRPSNPWSCGAGSRPQTGHVPTCRGAHGRKGSLYALPLTPLACMLRILHPSSSSAKEPVTAAKTSSSERQEKKQEKKSPQPPKKDSEPSENHPGEQPSEDPARGLHKSPEAP